MVSIRGNLAKLLTALLWVQNASSAAISVDNETSALDTRAAIEVRPCLSSGAVTAPKGSMVAAAKGLKSAPWFPHCSDIPDATGRNKCDLCFTVAAGVYGAAVVGCTTASVACLLVQPECEATCIAIASYTLWTSLQACYCEHANCSDSAVRASGNIGGPPELVIGGGHFTTSPVLIRGDNQLFNFEYPKQGQTINCPNRGCSVITGCRGGGGNGR